jgi:hypothetical protein
MEKTTFLEMKAWISFGCCLVMTLLTCGISSAGGNSGGGGTSVACFSIPKGQAVVRGEMTTAGRAHIVSAVPFEYASIMNIAGGGEKIRDMERRRLDFPQALKELDDTFTDYPRFVHFIRRNRKQHKLITQGIQSPGGLRVIHSSVDSKAADAQPAMNFGDDCDLVYTISRQDDLLYTDQTLLSFYSGTMLALQQWHEDLSQATGADHDSVPIQHFIIKTWGGSSPSQKALGNNINEVFNNHTDFVSLKTKLDFLKFKYAFTDEREESIQKDDAEGFVPGIVIVHRLEPKITKAQGKTTRECVINLIQGALDNVFHVSDLTPGWIHGFSFTATSDLQPGSTFVGGIYVNFKPVQSDSGQQVECSLNDEVWFDNTTLWIRRSDGQFYRYALSHGGRNAVDTWADRNGGY